MTNFAICLICYSLRYAVHILYKIKSRKCYKNADKNLTIIHYKEEKNYDNLTNNNIPNI